MACWIDSDGWFCSTAAPVRRILSPNADARPADVVIDLLVIHCISLPPGSFGGGWIDALFTNRLEIAAHPSFQGLAGLRVSSHLLIDRGGEVRQYVGLDQRAWHAGVSSWQGRARCNDYSIGIELEGDVNTPFTDAQYRTLSPVVRAIMARHPAITAERIVGHSDVAPGRKVDPGPWFEWARLRAAL
jgi:N-acetyl-anhydromuramoyl-L-alanine amidase